MVCTHRQETTIQRVGHARMRVLNGRAQPSTIAVNGLPRAVWETSPAELVLTPDDIRAGVRAILAAAAKVPPHRIELLDHRISSSGAAGFVNYTVLKDDPSRRPKPVEENEEGAVDAQLGADPEATTTPEAEETDTEEESDDEEIPPEDRVPQGFHTTLLQSKVDRKLIKQQVRRPHLPPGQRDDRPTYAYPPDS